VRAAAHIGCARCRELAARRWRCSQVLLWTTATLRGANDQGSASLRSAGVAKRGKPMVCAFCLPTPSPELYELWQGCVLMQLRPDVFFPGTVDANVDACRGTDACTRQTRISQWRGVNRGLANTGSSPSRPGRQFHSELLSGARLLHGEPLVGQFPTP
jgi:hypothetical protein